MNPEVLKTWLEVASLASGLATGLVAALWAYSKYILERGLLPPTRLWVTCESVGVQGNKHVVQVLLHIENLGSSTLIATDVRVDVLYLDKDDRLELMTGARRVGRLTFPNSLRKQTALEADSTGSESGTSGRGSDQRDNKARRGRGFALVPHDTFIQAGVHQAYTFVTALAEGTSFVLVHGSFRYAQRPRALASAALFVSRRLGLVQFTLAHVSEPHTTEQAFRLSSASAVSEPPNTPLQQTGGPAARS